MEREAAKLGRLFRSATECVNEPTGPARKLSVAKPRQMMKIGSKIEDTRRTLPIRAAIVGTGYIADFHARAIGAVKGVRLAAVCDANMRSARAFAANWDVPNVFELVGVVAAE